MARSEAQKRADAKYKASTMAQQNVAIRRETLEQFKALAAEHGDKVNTILREAIEAYIVAHAEQDPPAPVALPDGVTEEQPPALRSFRRGPWTVEVADRTGSVECWLAHDDCDAKQMMVTVLKPQHTVEDAIGLAMLNLDKQVELYKQDFLVE